MAGIIATAARNRELAKAGLRQAAQLEDRRNNTNDRLDDAEDAEKSSTVGTGAGMGLQYDMSEGGLSDIFGSGSEVDLAADSVTSGGSEAVGQAAVDEVAGGVVTDSVANGGAEALGQAAINEAAGAAVTDAAVVATTEAAATQAAVTAAAQTTGAVAGASEGAAAGSAAGPWGAVIGAGIGLLASSFF